MNTTIVKRTVLALVIAVSAGVTVVEVSHASNPTARPHIQAPTSGGGARLPLAQ